MTFDQSQTPPSYISSNFGGVRSWRAAGDPGKSGLGAAGFVCKTRKTVAHPHRHYHRNCANTVPWSRRPPNPPTSPGYGRCRPWRPRRCHPGHLAVAAASGRRPVSAPGPGAHQMRQIGGPRWPLPGATDPPNTSNTRDTPAPSRPGHGVPRGPRTWLPLPYLPAFQVRGAHCRHPYGWWARWHPAVQAPSVRSGL